MNKKIILTVAILLVAVFALCACKTHSLLEKYDGVKDAKNITQTISIKSGDTEIASEKRTYNMTTNKVEIERKTPSDLNASEPYTTTTETKDFTQSDAVAKLSGLTMLAVVETDTTFSGTVVNADLKTAFGVDGASVKGDALVQLLADDDGKITKMTVTYTSSNDNAVTITTVYAY